jgi:pyrroline-5-carboxylate reductase
MSEDGMAENGEQRETMEKINKKIACIGSGNMGCALMQGAARIAGGENIIFTDHTAAKAEAAARKVGGTALLSNAEAVRAAEIVFFAVKPAGIAALIQETAPFFTGEKVAVSMAAGVSLEKLAAAFAAAGKDAPPLVRIMPNTPAFIGKGVIALSASPAAGPKAAAAAELVRALLSGAGVVDTVEEKYLGAITALAGSGPAFAFLFLEALADGGVFAGLPRDKALRYAALTLEGAAAMAAQTGKHPAVLKDEVASPGGTTIRGIAALEARAFRGTVMSAVQSAHEACSRG